MRKHDEAVTFEYPHLLGAVYFGLLSVVGTILTNALLVSLGIEELVPLYQAILLGMLVSAAMGAIFGERIIHTPKPYKLKTFWMGFTMVIASLPLFDIGIFIFLKEETQSILPTLNMKDILSSYLIIVGYSYMLFGVPLAVCSGFAAMYLRGQMVYDIVFTDEYRKRCEARVLARLKKEAVHHKTHHVRKARRSRVSH